MSSPASFSVRSGLTHALPSGESCMWTWRAPTCTAGSQGNWQNTNVDGKDDFLAVFAKLIKVIEEARIRYRRDEVIWVGLPYHCLSADYPWIRTMCSTRHDLPWDPYSSIAYVLPWSLCHPSLCRVPRLSRHLDPSPLAVRFLGWQLGARHWTR